MSGKKKSDLRLAKIEKRLTALEKAVFQEKKRSGTASSSFEGLKGGIRFIIKNGFFKKLRSLSEIKSELKREGYHYSDASISKILTRDFTNKEKILNRIKEKKVWKYVIRK